MRVALGSDHAGVVLKNELKRAFDKATPGDHPLHTCIDVGTYSEESVDYPEFAQQVAEGVATNTFDRGILVCGSGIGISIAANRYVQVRAALVHDALGARMCRLHNDANVICFGARMIGEDVAKDCLDVFLNTEFEGGRHITRVDKLASPN